MAKSEMKICSQRYRIEKITNENLKVALNPFGVMGVIVALKFRTFDKCHNPWLGPHGRHCYPISWRWCYLEPSGQMSWRKRERKREREETRLGSWRRVNCSSRACKAGTWSVWTQHLDSTNSPRYVIPSVAQRERESTTPTLKIPDTN